MAVPFRNTTTTPIAFRNLAEKEVPLSVCEHTKIGTTHDSAPVLFPVRAFQISGVNEVTVGGRKQGSHVALMRLVFEI
jgi:hypothetical protein